MLHLFILMSNFCITPYKTRRVGYGDTTPSTDQLHQSLRFFGGRGTFDIWHLTHDMWHLTRDMWHVTSDTQGVGNRGVRYGPWLLSDSVVIGSGPEHPPTTKTVKCVDFFFTMTVIVMLNGPIFQAILDVIRQYRTISGGIGWYRAISGDIGWYRAISGDIGRY